MSQAAIFRETLHRLAMIDEGFGYRRSRVWAQPGPDIISGSQDHGAAAGSGAGGRRRRRVCLEWSVGRALVAGASEDEIAEVLPGIAPMSGLGRVVAAAPDLATALRYDASAHAVRGRTCCKPQASGSNPLTGSQVKRGLPPLAGADPPAVCLGPG